LPSEDYLLDFLVTVLLPPTSLAVLALFLMILGRVGRMLSAASLILLVTLGLPVVSTTLLNSLSPAKQEDISSSPAAIVILAGDAISVAGTSDLSPGLLTLDRERAGASLARRTKLPILLSGGPFGKAQTSLAEMMAVSMHNDFGLNAKWTEVNSKDTWQNAEFSANILRAAGIQTIYLVTQDWHMKRALLAFRHFGLVPIPVLSYRTYNAQLTWQRLVPTASSWLDSYFALHEWVGLAYYSMRQ